MMNKGDEISTRIDYLTAGRIGTWRLLRPVMRVWSNTDVDSSEACLRFSRGQVLRGDKLDYVYDYYRTVWTSVSTVSVAAFGVSGLIIKVLVASKPVIRVTLALITLPWFFILLVSMTLVGLGLLRGGLSQYEAELETKPKSYTGDHFQNGGNTDFFAALSVGLIAYVIGLLAVLLAR
jgi:hypothetical protein